MVLRFLAIILSTSLLSLWGEAAHGNPSADSARIVTVAKGSKQGWLGVAIQDMTKEHARSADSKVEKGALVIDVVEHSPADSAGIEAGDIIIEFDSKAIHKADDLVKAVGKTKPGAKAHIVVVRKGERKTLQVALGKNPRCCESFTISVPKVPCARVFWGDCMLGVELMELNKQLGEYFQAPKGEGVLVKSVEKESVAEKAGLKAGDVVIKVGTSNVNEIKDIRRGMEDYSEGDTVDVVIIRKGTQMKLSLEIGKEPCTPSFDFFYRYEPPCRQGSHFYFDGFFPYLNGLQRELRCHLRPELGRLRIEIQTLGKERQRQLREEIREAIEKHVKL